MATRRHPRLPGLVPDAATPSIVTVQRQRRPPLAANDNPRPAGDRRRLAILLVLASLAAGLVAAVALG
ncbi:MAG: hypothetical protein FJX53_10470 [Alphaproteobacteria bacterium]|nr:hypothetical protein [Alphaproteobacteria bacterium]